MMARFFPKTQGFLAIAALALLPALGSSARQSLTDDPGFEKTRGGDLGQWQIRYAIKAKDLVDKPLWQVSSKAADGGRHIAIDQKTRSVGCVYIGQKIRLPDPLPRLEISFDYQSYCDAEHRSGIIDAVVMLESVWQEIATEPAAAAATPESLIYSETLHKQGEDIVAWRHAQTSITGLASALKDFAGQEVVVAIAWSTWHATSNEWARFDNFNFGAPLPRIEFHGLGEFTTRGEPMLVSALASSVEENSATLQIRPKGNAASWSSIAMKSMGNGKFEALLNADYAKAAFEIRAVAQAPGGEEMSTSIKEIKVVEPREHPCIIYSRAELDRMREKIEEFDWAKEEWKKIESNAVKSLGRSDDPPLGKAGWSHDWVCADDGASLQFREDFPTRHLCPICKKEWQGPKLDACWRSTIHSRFINGARDMALAGQITDDSKYARAAARIVLWYADHYSDFAAMPGRPGKGGIVNSQSLSESSWLIKVVNVVDLTWDAMTPEERSRIERSLLRPAIEHLLGYTHGIHNIQCWNNAAAACVGYLLNDPSMIEHANQGKLGFRNQVEKGILEDGMWFERSMSYHYYTIKALTAHCLAAMHAGDDLHKIGRVRKMFTAPLQLAQPNLIPPSLNDMKYTKSMVAAIPMEYAVAWYGDKEAEQGLRYLYNEKGRSRVSLEAWQVGEALPETGELTAAGSIDLSGMGLAILRRGAGENAICAMLEYGEHGGGHGHPDKLQLIIYALGQTLCPDLGTTGYGVDMHGEYYKTTPGHNTVTVGGVSQKGTTGKLVTFGENERYATASATVDDCYEDFELARRILLADSFLVDEFIVEGKKPDTIDWFLRSPGSLELSVATQPITEKPLSAAYKYFSDQRGAEVDGQWTAQWKLPGGRLIASMKAEPKTQVVQSVAPGPIGTQFETLRARRQAKQTRFTVVYQFVTDGEQPAKVNFEAGAVVVGENRVLLPKSKEEALSM